MEKVQWNSIDKKQNGLKYSKYYKSSILPRALPTTLSCSFRCESAAEHHTAEQCSKTGRTKLQKDLKKSDRSWNTWQDILMIPSLFACSTGNRVRASHKVILTSNVTSTRQGQQIPLAHFHPESMGLPGMDCCIPWETAARGFLWPNIGPHVAIATIRYYSLLYATIRYYSLRCATMLYNC